MSELIFEKGPLAIRAQSAENVDMVSLIGRTVWGSGDTRYRIRDAELKVQLLKGSQFITLEFRGRLAGVYVLRQKRVTTGEDDRPAYYGTYFAMEDTYRAKGYGTLLLRTSAEYCRPGLGGAGVLYAYVEADNLRSRRAFERSGCRTLATFRTAVFSRIRPRAHPAVRPLESAEAAAVVDSMQVLYGEHNLRDFAQSLDPAGYFVFTQGPAIAAGVQVETCDWVIERLPGVSGWLLVKLVSRTPLLKRIFDARRCRFLKFGNLYARPGDESRLFALMESVLARYRVGSGMIFYDPRSPVFQRIARAGSFGIVNSGVDATVDVMGSLFGFTAAAERQFRNTPIVVSPLDIG